MIEDLSIFQGVREFWCADKLFRVILSDSNIHKVYIRLCGAWQHWGHIQCNSRNINKIHNSLQQSILSN